MAAEITLDLNRAHIEAMNNLFKVMCIADVLPMMECPREAYQALKAIIYLQIELDNYLNQPEKEKWETQE